MIKKNIFRVFFLEILNFKPTNFSLKKWLNLATFPPHPLDILKNSFHFPFDLISAKLVTYHNSYDLINLRWRRFFSAIYFEPLNYGGHIPEVEVSMVKKSSWIFVAGFIWKIYIIKSVMDSINLKAEPFHKFIQPLY